MKQMKFYGKQMIQFIGSTLIFTILLSIFQYMGWMSSKFSHILSLMFILLLCFILGIFSGKNATNKGYIEGLKISGFIILFLLFLQVIFFQSGFPIQRILYYVLIIISTIIGAMIGINKKKK